MTQADVVAEVKAALAPKEVFVVARSAFGGLVAAVAAPPAERLQGSVAEFLEEQLRSEANSTDKKAEAAASGPVISIWSSYHDICFSLGSDAPSEGSPEAGFQTLFAPE